MIFTPPRRLPWLLLVSAFIFISDRLTKIWVGARIPIGGAIPIIPRFLRITHWTNNGAAFSMFADSASPHAVRIGLIAFTLLAAVAVLVAMFKLGGRITLTTVALALIFGGALGNVHDRIAYGSVVDFIEVHIFGTFDREAIDTVSGPKLKKRSRDIAIWEVVKENLKALKRKCHEL